MPRLGWQPATCCHQGAAAPPAAPCHASAAQTGPDRDAGHLVVHSELIPWCNIPASADDDAQATLRGRSKALTVGIAAVVDVARLVALQEDWLSEASLGLGRCQPMECASRRSRVPLGAVVMPCAVMLSWQASAHDSASWASRLLQGGHLVGGIDDPLLVPADHEGAGRASLLRTSSGRCALGHGCVLHPPAQAPPAEACCWILQRWHGAASSRAPAQSVPQCALCMPHHS